MKVTILLAAMLLNVGCLTTSKQKDEQRHSAGFTPEGVQSPKQQSEERVSPGKLPKCKYMSAKECIVFDDVNRMRIAQGIHPLLPHNGCAQVARNRVKQWDSRRQSSVGKGHRTPRGDRLQDTTQRMGFQFIKRGATGENLASARKTSASGIANLWFNSTKRKRIGNGARAPSHQDNLLNPKFKYMGIGHGDGRNWSQCLTAAPVDARPRGRNFVRNFTRSNRRAANF